MCFYGFLIAILGVVLGFLYMVSFEPAVIKTSGELESFKAELAERAVRPGDYYLMQAPAVTVKPWDGKRLALLYGRTGEMTLSHSEINAWLASKFQPSPAPNGANIPNTIIIPGVPNLYFGLYRTHLNLPTEFIVYGKSFKRTISMLVELSKSDDSINCEVMALNIGNARVPFVNLLGEPIFNILLEAYSGSEEFVAMKAALANVESIDSSEGNLHFVLR